MAYILIAGRNPASKWWPDAPKPSSREPRNGRPLTAQKTKRGEMLAREAEAVRRLIDMAERSRKETNDEFF